METDVTIPYLIGMDIFQNDTVKLLIFQVNNKRSYLSSLFLYVFQLDLFYF